MKAKGHLTRPVWLILLSSACGAAPEPGGVGDRSDAGTPDATGTVGEIDWDRRASTFQAPGWSIAFCEGDSPFLCVEREGRALGSVELVRTAVSDHSTLADVIRRGGSEREALDAAAADFVAGLNADRRIGFGDGYHLEAEPVAPATVMGSPGLRLVVEGRIADRVIERIQHYYAIRRDTFHVFAATGTDGGQAGEFTTDDLREFERLFAAIVAASRPGTPAPTSR